MLGFTFQGCQGIPELETKAVSQASLAIAVTTPEPENESKHPELVQHFEHWADILLVSCPAKRLVCFHLGVLSTDDLCSVYEIYESLIGLMHFQTLSSFMESLGYVPVGEEAFDGQQNRISCSTKTWNVRGKTQSFISEGYQFFVNPDMAKDSPERSVVTVVGDSGKENLMVGFITQNFDFSQRMQKLHNQYTKTHNMLRGAKLRNVNVSLGTFEEVAFGPEHSWENYHYPDKVRAAFNRYVQRFLERNKEYNDRGITKRGILFKGPPGTGKTTLGKISCNVLKDFSFMWITSDVIVENSNGMSAIKKLYQLADYIAPCAAFLEDLDLFGEDRDGRTETVSLGAMMNVFDGVNSMKNIVTMATTNRPELIEKALVGRPGRFDAIVEVPEFSRELRIKMFDKEFSASKFQVDKGVVEYFVENSDQWSGATMQELINVINMIFIERNDAFPDHITMEVAKEAMKMIRNSTPAAKKREKGTGFNAERSE